MKHAFRRLTSAGFADLAEDVLSLIILCVGIIAVFSLPIGS